MDEEVLPISLSRTMCCLLKNNVEVDNNMHTMLLKILAFCANPMSDPDSQNLGYTMQLAILKALKTCKDQAEFQNHLTQIAEAGCRGIPYYCGNLEEFSEELTDKEKCFFAGSENVFFKQKWQAFTSDQVSDSLNSHIKKFAPISESNGKYKILTYDDLPDPRPINTFMTGVPDAIGAQRLQTYINEIKDGTKSAVLEITSDENVSTYDQIPGYMKWIYALTGEDAYTILPEEYKEYFWDHPKNVGTVVGEDKTYGFVVKTGTIQAPSDVKDASLAFKTSQGTPWEAYGISEEQLLKPDETAACLQIDCSGDNKCCIVVAANFENKPATTQADITEETENALFPPADMLLTRNDIAASLLNFHF